MTMFHDNTEIKFINFTTSKNRSLVRGSFDSKTMVRSELLFNSTWQLVGFYGLRNTSSVCSIAPILVSTTCNPFKPVEINNYSQPEN